MARQKSSLQYRRNFTAKPDSANRRDFEDLLARCVAEAYVADRSPNNGTSPSKKVARTPEEKAKIVASGAAANGVGHG